VRARVPLVNPVRGSDVRVCSARPGSRGHYVRRDPVFRVRDPASCPAAIRRPRRGARGQRGGDIGAAPSGGCASPLGRPPRSGTGRPSVVGGVVETAATVTLVVVLRYQRRCFADHAPSALLDLAAAGEAKNDPRWTDQRILAGSVAPTEYSSGSGLPATNIHRQKSRASARVVRFHGTSIAHKNRNQRSRSIPYERSVASDRPAACKSRKNADTDSTGTPAESSSRNDNHGSPVCSSEPVNGTASVARSRSASSSPITAGDHNRIDPSQPANLRKRVS
jgi:hypothetical protein